MGSRNCVPPRARCAGGTDAGGRVLALGNGGSATDAMDAVADLRFPPAGWPSRAAIDLTEDPGILTAIANDVGVDGFPAVNGSTVLPSARLGSRTPGWWVLARTRETKPWAAHLRNQSVCPISR